MIRKAITLSLMLALALLVVIWIASYTHRYTYELPTRQGALTSGFMDGKILIAVTNRQPTPSRLLGALGFRNVTPPSFHTHHRFHHALFVPIWLLLAITGTFPVIALIRGPLRHRYRRRSGLCLKCGYNLKGNQSGTCPECGTKIGKP